MAEVLAKRLQVLGRERSDLEALIAEANRLRGAGFTIVEQFYGDDGRPALLVTLGARERAVPEDAEDAPPVVVFHDMSTGEAMAVEAAPGDAMPGKVTRSNLAAGNWTPEEEALALQMRTAGESDRAIAERLGRTEGGVTQKLMRLEKRRARAAAADRAAARAGDAGDGPLNPPAAPPLGARTPEVSRDLRVHARLNALAPSDVWTPERDLALAEGICAGRKLGDLQEEFGLGREDLKVRWGQLMRGEPTLAKQERLLRVLRARAGA